MGRVIQITNLEIKKMADYLSKSKEKGKFIAYHSDSSDEFPSYYDYYSEGDEDDNNDDDKESVLLLCLEKLNLGSKKKKLLVFNLNGVLIHRDHKKSPSTKYRSPDGVFGSQVVYKRPFLDKFLKFCLERFEVGLWSSAQVQNTDGVVESVLQEYESRFLFVWDQDRCSDYGYKLPDKKRKPMFFKELANVWSSLAAIKRQFYESNTLLIDNEPYKALLNPPNTGIFLETYSVRDATDNALDLKNELGLFLEGLAEANDVPSYVKSHPIGQPALGPTHPDWEFYSRICRLFKN
ncbi:uncharacterized protein LOC141652699 [Silene latifolia]|uniref:uncharacterized protein LOC141652699 n=1 Tax=Silene latifolia TaxID=37657 RepID=UPI003D78A95D